MTKKILILFIFTIIFISAETSVSYAESAEKQNSSAVSESSMLVSSAEVYASKGNYDLALIALDRAVRLDPANYRAYFLRGEIYRLQKNFQSAADSYSSAIEFKPDLCSAYLGRGKSYESAGNYNFALTDYNYIIERFPDYSPAYDARGELYRKNGQYSSAIADLSQALKLAPRNNSAYLNRAKAYMELGYYDYALTDLESIEAAYAGIPLGGKIGDEIAWTHFYKGKIYELLSGGNHEYFQKAHESYKLFLSCSVPEDGDKAVLYANHYISGKIISEEGISPEIAKVVRMGTDAILVEMKVINNTDREIYSIEVPHFDLSLDGVQIGRRPASFEPRNDVSVRPYSTGSLFFVIYNYPHPFSNWNTSVFDYTVRFRR